MNGQYGRQELIRSLLGLRPPSIVVETGTYLGSTTQYFAWLAGVQVWTCESQRIYFQAAAPRFKDNPLIHAVHSDSRTFLRGLAADENIPKSDAFFYLDAHWDASLPLREEIRIIGESWQRPWILIDDFAVPEDPGYAFDDYGGGSALMLDYLEPASWWIPFFPTRPSSAETGARRGCVLLAPPEDRARLIETGLLRQGN